MLGQMESQSVLLWNKLPMPLKPPATMAASYTLASFRRTSSTTSAPATSAVLNSKPEATKSIPLASTQSLVSAAPPIQVMKNQGFQPTPELGLLSLSFVLSMAFGAFLSVALVSIPTMIAFERLGASMKKLSKVASEEVPGTLTSLKLSSMELNDLTQQLSNLRHKISGIRIGKKERSTDNRRSFQERNPAS